MPLRHAPQGVSPMQTTKPTAGGISSAALARDPPQGKVSMPLRIDRIVAVLGVATLFMPGFRIRTDALDLYLYYALLPLIVVLCVAAGGRLLSRGLAILIAALAVHSALSTALFGNSLMAAAQQIIGISAISIMFYSVFYLNRFDIVYIFRIYLGFAKAAALIGLFQVVSFLIGFRPGYDLGWLVLDFYYSFNSFGFPRIQSIFSEPSNFAIIMSPAFYAATLRLFGGSPYPLGRGWAVLLLLMAVLSFSTMAYVAVFFSFCLIAFRHGWLRRTALAGIAGLLTISAYALIPDFQVRVDDTLFAFLYADPLQKNISSLTLYNNWQVALAHLKDTYLLGGGLGSHPVAFERHSVLFAVDSVPYWLASLNSKDANSLLLRVLSELGLPGVFALAWFVVSRHVGSPSAVSGGIAHPAWIVSNAALTFIIVAAIRHGHYFALGTPFFFLLYFYGLDYARASLQTLQHAESDVPGLTETA